MIHFCVVSYLCAYVIPFRLITLSFNSIQLISSPIFYHHFLLILVQLLPCLSIGKLSFPPRSCNNCVGAPSSPNNAISRCFFAQVWKAPHSISSNENLPQPSIRGEKVSITISQEVYEKGMAFCKRHLCGRLVMNKGEKPYLARDIQLKLQKQWKTEQTWTMLSLGRGYYEFSFDSEADLRSIFERWEQ